MHEIELSPGFRINIPSRTKEAKFIYDEIFNKRIYLQHGITLKDGDTVLDVGANVGLFDIHLMQSYADLKIYAFEPVPPTFRCLQRNIAKHGGTNRAIKLFPTGMSSNAGTAQIEFMPLAPGNSTMFPTEKRAEARIIAGTFTLRDAWKINKAWTVFLFVLYPFRRYIVRGLLSAVYLRGKTFTVPLTTLNSVFDDESISSVDLLKIDVEGAELNVLSGISDDNLKKVRQVVIELSPANRSAIPAIVDRLNNAGMTRVTAESMAPDADPLISGWPVNIYATR